ncbi:O-methyltransferase [Vitiosangium sp. GDMCC 1.1324]|uniref:O-methyltransferase n=1 Tax=Vitiosangium sp. (strain GDMCC 1.1324) TaxID=2138576 RepID=UPI000D365223|nr:class I SAM-dependent methyltransferase [Vitiosangium sp. GDMCC 1.1324]PTL81303.1 methyltransferase [Vitiosangium sp. GDMCC 1.1324]
MFCLEEPRIQGVIAEILSASQRDSNVIERARAIAAGWDAPPTLAQMSDLCVDAAMPVRPEVGRLLYMLVRMLRPTTIVEFGTSFGASLIHLAAAVRDNGVGFVTGSEMNKQKISKAQENIERTGLQEFVRILQGDARESLAGVAGPIDFILLDGFKELYLPVLEVLEPKMRPGTVVVADNLSMLPQNYLDRVRSQGSGYVSVSLPLGDGIELSLRQP